MYLRCGRYVGRDDHPDDLESRIAQALEQNYFEIHFLCVCDAQSRLETCGSARSHADLQQPDQLIMPGQFIPVAEKSGQILDIDNGYCSAVIALAKHAQMPIAVNISGRSFDDPSLPRFIQTTEQASWIRRLIIELTETSAVSDIQDAQRFIEAINQAGKVCLDDFGSGFSTFVISNILVEILKIDGMFIRSG